MIVNIGLYQDVRDSRIEALILEDGHGGTRLSGSKGCGSWNLVKMFRCQIELQDLKDAAMEEK